jgi:insulysin
MQYHTIQKPDVDDRQYKYFKLVNDLQCVVISHPTADRCAAALDVHVGHFSDPKEVAGLAHFCEHMLFLGTEKYPDEGSYQAFVKHSGGRTNAYTSTENTNYYFDIVPDHFKEGLDRFAQFFIAPLFTADATSREMKAVNSEHNKNIQEDTRRKHHFMKLISNPEHPYHKFGTGNLETLDEIPKQNSIDIREALLSFHDKHYSSNTMTLAVR